MKYNNTKDTQNICFGNTENNFLPLHKSNNPHTMTLLTIDELFEKYPQVQKDMGWIKEQIEVFYESHLLTGEVDKTTQELKINQDDFEKLLELYENTTINQKELMEELKKRVENDK